MQERASAVAAAALRKWDHQDLNPRVPRPPHPPPSRVVITSPRTQEDAPPSHVVCWPVLIGAFIIQLVVPSVLTSHGVYVAHLLQSDRISYGAAILPPAVFSATWSLTDPWCRKVGLRHRGADCRLLAGCGVLLLAMSLAATALSVYSLVRVLTFGIIGGLGCSLAVSQCEAQLALHLTAHHSLSLSVSFVAQALGHFLFPLVLVGLLAGYGAAGAPLLQCALVLHGVAGALLFRTAPRFFMDTAMSMQLSTYSSLLPDEGGEGLGGIRSWRNPSTQDTSCAEEEGDDEEGEEGDQGGRLRNHMGVEIMPQIPEEDETEEEEVTEASRAQAGNHQLFPGQRDSWCPVAPLGIYLPTSEDSTVQGDSPKPLLTPSSLSGLPRQVFDFRAPTCCAGCGSRMWSGLQKGCRAFCKSLREVCRPALVPGLLVSSAVRLVPLGVAVLTPTIAQHLLHLPRHEAAFTIAVAGFGWLCLGVCTPCLLAQSARKHASVIFALASCLSALGLLIMSHPVSHDRLTLGCVVVGMAHGALMLSSPLLLRQMWGETASLVQAQNLLDRGAGLILLLAAMLSWILAEGATSYCVMLLILAGLQACLGAVSIGWVIVQHIRLRLHVDVQRRSREASTSTEQATDWVASILNTS